MDLPSVKHYKYHECAYCCRYHTHYNRTVPSVGEHGFIARYNLLHLLKALNIRAAEAYGNKVLIGDGTGWVTS